MHPIYSASSSDPCAVVGSIMKVLDGQKRNIMKVLIFKLNPLFWNILKSTSKGLK